MPLTNYCNHWETDQCLFAIQSSQMRHHQEHCLPDCNDWRLVAPRQPLENTSLQCHSTGGATWLDSCFQAHYRSWYKTTMIHTANGDKYLSYCRDKNWVQWHKITTCCSRSFKVTDFGTRWKHVCNFLLLNKTNSILSHPVPSYRTVLVKLLLLTAGTSL